MLNKLVMYTDGACRTTDKTGGWCYILVKNDKQIALDFGPVDDTTNNRMEAQACIEGLNFCAENGIKEVTIITDSQYVIGTASQGWKRNTNQDILGQLDEAIGNMDEVVWKHVKGHAGDKWNEKCDAFAVTASNYNK